MKLDGGELAVEVGGELDVLLTGTAEPVFQGELSPELMRVLKRARLRDHRALTLRFPWQPPKPPSAP